ncbi:hypothetical protein AB0I66_16325 [Streptomyces sp. NPDC050439]|uniref:hypothetical protein n=1 Tax=unclassified Streptomyces TaxID=2593676 RepID=UPI00342B9B1E
MKIAKATAGLLGVGLALGTASAAQAAQAEHAAHPAPRPPADGGTLLDSVAGVAPALEDVQNPLDQVAVDPATGELRANNPSAVTAPVDGAAQAAAQSAVSLLGGLPAGAPLGG